MKTEPEATTQADPFAVELEQYGWSEAVLRLSAEQREALRSHSPRLVEAVEEEPGQYRLRAGKYVGSSRLEDLRILVRPRFQDLGNVFFLVGYAEGIAHWGSDSFPYEFEHDFFRAMAWLFESELGRALRLGLLRAYEDRRETLPTVRGRIDVARQIGELQGRAYPLACHYQDFVEDTELNRVVKAAIERIRRMPDLPIDLALKLRRHLSTFSEVSSTIYHPANVPRFEFNRLNQQWKAAGWLARMILQYRTLTDRHGAIRGATFAIDMNKVFERFIETVVGQSASRRGFQLLPQAQRNLTDDVVMKPDLVIRKAGVDLAVGDIKYKAIDPTEGDWEHPDLYQLLAYTTALKLPAGILIYAEAGEEQPTQVVRGAGTTLRIAEVDLSGTPDEIRVRAEAVADRLVDQAEERLAGAESASLSHAAAAG